MNDCKSIPTERRSCEAMGKTSRILLVLCALILGSVSSSAAVTGHNLHWGFEIGDQFHYRYRGNTNLSDKDFYVEVDSLPTIPSNVSSIYDIDFSSLNYSYYYEDGTEMDFYMSWIAMPIGNWSLIQELLNATAHLPDIQWINTLSEWGFRSTETYTTLERTTTLKFSKGDGIMTLYQLVDESTVLPNTTMEIRRRDFSSIPYLYIGIGVGAFAVIAIVVVVMKRR